MTIDPIRFDDFTIDELLSVARKSQIHITDSLPEGVDPLSLPSRSSKTPDMALCFRDAQYCRFEELFRAACDLFERDDVVAANLCVRAMIETAASIWFAMELIQNEVETGLSGKLHKKMVQLLLGQRLEPETELPVSINILTIIDHADKKIPKLRKNYDRLSEFAHPNWSGALGAYGSRDEDTLITWFKPNKSDLAPVKRIGLSLTILSVQMIEEAYNELLDAALKYAELEIL